MLLTMLVIQVGGSSKVEKYNVVNTEKKEVYWNVFKSKLKEPGICDNECSKIGRLTITIPSLKADKIGPEVSMKCQGTELEAFAKTVQGGITCKANFDFLGMDELLSGDEDKIPEKIE